MSADRKGRQRCPRCGRKAVLTEGRCHRCRQRAGLAPLNIKRRMPRQNIEGVLKHLKTLGIEAEAVETTPGNITIRPKAKVLPTTSHQFYWADKQAHQTCERCGASIMDAGPCKQ